jgi:Flp pilus assembly protein TadG
LTVEIIVLTPVILLIALTVLIFGRVTQSRQQVVEAARAGAEAAAVMPNAADAQWGSEVDAAVGAADSGHRCVRQQVASSPSRSSAR